MLAPDASKLADDCWRVQVTNARLEGCTATEVTATSRKRPDASCRHPDREQHRIRDGRAPRAYSEVAHQASKSCSLRWTNAHAQERGASAPRGSRNRTCSGVAQLFGRHPTHTLASASAVTVPPYPRRADARRSWLGESPPACALRFPLHACSPNHDGLTPAALVPGESPSACGLRFPLPVRSFEPGSANPLLCTAEVAFSPATEWRAPGPRFSVNGSSVAPNTEVALKRLEMAVIGQVEMQRGNGDVAFSQGGDIRVGRGL